MNTKPIPAIVMLIASIITCIVAIITHIETVTFLKILIWVIIIFYIIGIIVKKIFDYNIKIVDDKFLNEEVSEEEAKKEAEKDINIDKEDSK